ncbi:MAG: sigma-70 family RNA polymerase sigma factor [Alphaproteobacteria bacterium]|nr:sigma-70 family RNA polymerase sigma factor [Alphaproteobacteria bacterium]MDE2041966.1 sigma-70 family RNA polymerase sigma factor [Alphaproteobacteria bacterium]MDE2340744.1 sigma-70 family RNA polymerase sigma factor [Alphaproteobacteria bacterium]
MRLLRARTGNDEDAEDIAQNIWLKIQRSSLPAQIENPKGFIVRMAMNMATDHHRAARNRLRLNESWVETHTMTIAEQPIDETPSPEACLMAKAQFDVVVAAIDQLPNRARQIFILHKIEGFSQVHVAADLGISLSAVEKHIAAALAKIATFIGEH